MGNRLEEAPAAASLPRVAMVAASWRAGGGRLLFSLFSNHPIRVIRGKPGAASKRCRGTETSAEDLVGPPERMVSERRSTAVVQGDPKRSRRQPNGRLRPANRHPPPSASYSASEGIGGRGLGNLVRPESPRATRFPGAVNRPGGQAGDRILRSPRSAPPSIT